MAKGRWKAALRGLFGGSGGGGDDQSDDPLQMDLTKWQQVTLDSGDVAFERDPGDQLIAFSFDKAPDIPVPLEQIDELRAFYRQQVTEAGGGIVSIEIVDVDGTPAVETLFKFPQEPTGMSYLGSLTIPFRYCSYVMKVQCPELGMTGMRDSVVVASLDNLDFEMMESLPNEWARDPYEPEHPGPVLRNKSDDVEWDEKFPEHPLSRARMYLKELRDTTKISEALRSSAPFAGPS